MASPEKKIRISGWDPRPYREVRRKVENFFNTEERLNTGKSLKRHKNLCKRNHMEPHEYKKGETRDSFFKIYTYTIDVCIHCGKQKYNWNK